jgi:hypothetical protein
MRRRSKRVGSAGSREEGGGAEEDLPWNRARVQRGECVDPAVEGLVSFAGRLEPIAHGMAAHEAGADFLAGELVEKFLLVGDREMTVARSGGVGFLRSVAPNVGLNRRRSQFNYTLTLRVRGAVHRVRLDPQNG